MMSASQRPRAVLLLFVCAILWSLGGLFLKKVDWHPLAVAGGRGLVAGIFLLAWVRRPRFTWSATQVGAAVAYAVCTVLFAVANKFTTAANAIFIQYTAPVYIALFSFWMLGERTKPSDWITIALTLAGMALFFVGQLTMATMLGNLIAVGSSLGFAAMAILLRKQKDGSPIESIILGNLLAGAIGLPFMLTSAPPDAESIGALLVLGVFQLGLPYLLFAWSISRVTAMEAVLIPVVEPVLNPLWVLLFLGERPGPLALLGGAVVLAAVVMRAMIALRGGRLQPAPVS